jgi:hypothetical protein
LLVFITIINGKATNCVEYEAAVALDSFYEIMYINNISFATDSRDTFIT